MAITVISIYVCPIFSPLSFLVVRETWSPLVYDSWAHLSSKQVYDLSPEKLKDGAHTRAQLVGPPHLSENKMEKQYFPLKKN
ncbi:hypothetical protein EUGRSUZ_F03924 [Eucalyptus grandis]|uniref:Uncharacterized protein n=2 Tax=Eucalyptus grandis TaxID=71139 RepID=A0ACC3KQC9_EUCGR|nr:hypothetical protein EUGRSUZ_F03924 [Eucalyptus grandis]